MEFKYDIWVDSAIPAEASALTCNHLAIHYKFFHLQTSLNHPHTEELPLAASRDGTLTIPCHRYFNDASAITRHMISNMGVADTIILEEMVSDISSFVVGWAKHASFSGCRILNFCLQLTVEDSNDEEENLELLMRELAAQAVLHTVPAAKSSIVALKEVDMDATSTTQEFCCAICLEELSSRRAKKVLAVKMPCSHVFHKKCIVKWLESGHSCPLCRYTMPTSS